MNRSGLNVSTFEGSKVYLTPSTVTSPSISGVVCSLSGVSGVGDSGGEGDGVGEGVGVGLGIGVGVEEDVVVGVGVGVGEDVGDGVGGRGRFVYDQRPNPIMVKTVIIVTMMKDFVGAELDVILISAQSSVLEEILFE